MEIEAVEQAFGAIGSDILPAYDGGINLNILRETFEGGTRASLPEYMLKAEKFDGRSTTCWLCVAVFLPPTLF